MNKDEFLSFVAHEFQEEEGNISLATSFKELALWSSLNALIFISNIHDKFQVLITSSDLAKSNDLKDIYNLIKSRV